jgi:Protein of unknown function (DUF2631)
MPTLLWLSRDVRPPDLPPVVSAAGSGDELKSSIPQAITSAAECPGRYGQISRSRYARMTAMASTEVERYKGVDVEDVPSKDWGWSGDAPRLWHWVGIFIAGFLLAMMRGNHVGWVENWYLIAFAGLVLVWVVRDWYLRRRGLTR